VPEVLVPEVLVPEVPEVLVPEVVSEVQVRCRGDGGALSVARMTRPPEDASPRRPGHPDQEKAQLLVASALFAWRASRARRIEHQSL
jgi:hypothetical protein